MLAHPDDESLGMGGVLARSATDGVETHLVTATSCAAGGGHPEAGVIAGAHAEPAPPAGARG